MRPLVPRGWKTTNAVQDAKKKTLPPKHFAGGKAYPCFNGSQNKRNKKRPITLPERA